MINVVEEEVECGDSLHQAGFEERPLGRRDDARNQVEGKDPLGALGVAVDIERDALPHKCEVDRPALGLDAAQPTKLADHDQGIAVAGLEDGG